MDVPERVGAGFDYGAKAVKTAASLCDPWSPAQAGVNGTREEFCAASGRQDCEIFAGPITAYMRLPRSSHGAYLAAACSDCFPTAFNSEHPFVAGPQRRHCSVVTRARPKPSKGVAALSEVVLLMSKGSASDWGRPFCCRYQVLREDGGSSLGGWQS